jgi:ATP phosphoribosyltransferase
MLKLALPTGDLRAPVAHLLAQAGLANEAYAAGSRELRLSHALPNDGVAMLRVFRERDIPIQVALGNYDLAVCGLAAIQELLLRFPEHELTLLAPLSCGEFQVHLATTSENAAALGPIAAWPSHAGLRIASDLPALAEAFALAARLPRARVIPVLGSAEAYPPEDADLAVVQVTAHDEVAARGLVSVAMLLSGGAWLVANRHSLATKDLGSLIGPLMRLPAVAQHGAGLTLPRLRAESAASAWSPPARTQDEVRLAVPDGHQQRHAFASLGEAGFHFGGYGEKEYRRRPDSGIPGLAVKVIRPQDMPQQVALGNFDLAMTGRDVLRDHLLAFPDSPVEEAVDLGRSRYRIAAVVDERLPADTVRGAIDYFHAQGIFTIRIASEYPNIADHYARTHHFGRYRVLPIAGASEGFVPDDAEVLIEGSETGTSIAANRLKPIDWIFESTNCLVAGRRPLSPTACAVKEQVVQAFRRATSAPVGR